MSSLKESDVITDTPNEHVDLNDTPNEHVNSSDGASFEEENMIDEDDVDVGSKRKKKAGAWLHFEKVEVMEEGKKVKKHRCIHCKKLYKPQASKTTSHLNRHLKKCSHMKRLKGKKCFINFGKATNDATEIGLSGGFDQMKCRETIARMIVTHELSFCFVEYHWFNVLMKYMNPFYQKVSRGTIRRDCIRVIEAEREKMKKVFKKIDMISLTSDYWTSNQTIGYMCLTAHYIDSDWKMKKFIIGFNELAPPHSGEVITDAILECLIKWGIQDKIGTITLDNASNSDRAASILRNTFQGKGKLHFEDGLGTIDDCLIEIREGVKYLKTSSGRLLKFGEISVAHGIQTHRSLCLDVKTRWNSTQRMLESAIYYKLSFEGYALRDSNFEWSLMDEEWDRAKKVCKLLEVFLDATNLFSGASYPTANLFLVEIFKVKKEITNVIKSNDFFLKKIGAPMFDKFEKYWGEIGLLMSIASILDPCFKKEAVEWTFKKLYPEKEVKVRVEVVINKLKSLFEKYSNAFRVARAADGMGTSSDGPNVRARDDDFYAYLETKPVETTQKTKLNVYLDEPNYAVSRISHFDVLEWWYQNSSKYPVLSKMACHIFCIPITTVASESAFSTGGRVLDDYRSSLSKDMVELFVCGGDWIKAASKAAIKTLEQSTHEEENLEIPIPTGDAASMI